MLTWAFLGVVEFIGVAVGSLGRAYASSGSFRFAWVHLCAPTGRRVHFRFCGFTGEGLGDVLIIRVRVVSLEGVKASSGSLRFA